MIFYYENKPNKVLYFNAKISHTQKFAKFMEVVY